MSTAETILTVVWPMDRTHYLTTFDDEYLPYYSSSQRMVDYGLDCGWAVPDNYESNLSQRARLRIDNRLGWQLTTRALGMRWLTVKEFRDTVEGGTGDIAIIAHQLAAAVKKGAAERRRVARVCNGRPVQRWCYRVLNPWWEPDKPGEFSERRQS